MLSLLSVGVVQIPYFAMYNAHFPPQILKVCFIDYAIIVVPISLPFIPFLPAPPHPPASPPHLDHVHGLYI